MRAAIIAENSKKLHCHVMLNSHCNAKHEGRTISSSGSKEAKSIRLRGRGQGKHD